jgi:FtsZ-binding cell division protein ZapB
MTPDQCFDEMAKVLGFTKPEDTGYIAILQKVKELKEENDNLRCDICRYDDVIEAREDDVKMSSALIQKLEREINQLKEENDDLQNEVCSYSNAIEEEYVLKTDYEKLKEEAHNYNKGYERIKKEFKSGIEVRDKIIEVSKKLRKEKNEWREKAIIYSNKSLKELQS